MGESTPHATRPVLPPAGLRAGPRDQHDDRVYVENGVALATSVAQLLQLHQGRFQSPAESLAGLNLLDWGCGSARLLTGLQQLGVDFARYTGVDVKAATIDWCQQHLAAERVTFHTVDIQNARYNPGGRPLNEVELAHIPSGHDLIVLRSVFTHMLLADMGAHLAVLRPLLAPGGQIYVSVFAEYGVPAESENPPGYRVEPSGPLHCVRVDRGGFEGLARQAGLQVSVFCQSILDQPTFLLEPID